jgi:hypothetical protein
MGLQFIVARRSEYYSSIQIKRECWVAMDNEGFICIYSRTTKTPEGIKLEQ